MSIKNLVFRFVTAAAVAFGVASSFAQDAQPLEKSCEFRVNYKSEVNLDNFPLMVRLSEGDGSGFKYNSVAADGSDIRFSLPDGTVLNHEIALWNTSGESIVYVGVPQLRAGMSLILRWKKSSPDAELPAIDSKAVWTSAGYMAVWHFDQNVNGGFKNSARDDFIAIPRSGISAPNLVVGASGGAVNIAKTHPLVAEGEGISIVKPFTISAWTLYTMATNEVDRNSGRIWTTGTAAQSYNKANLFFNFQQEYVMGDNNYKTIGNYHCRQGVWQYLTAVYGAGTTRCNIDGKQVMSSPTAVNKNTTPHTIFGLGGWTDATADNNGNFTGCLDEIRIRNCESSIAWTKAEYENTRSAVFVTPKVPQFRNLERCCTIMASGLPVDVALTNFPLMVRLSPENKFGFSYAAAAADGSDIRFFDADGYVLNHEVALWNPSGESILYVSVPVLTRETVLKMYWRKKTPTTLLPTVSGSEVWTAAGYRFVWHFDCYNSTIGGYPNSAEEVYYAKPVAAVPESVLGAQGAAAGIYGERPMLASGSGYLLCEPFSVSCWSRYPAGRWDCDVNSGRIWTCGENNTVMNIFFNWHQGVVMGDGWENGHYIVFQQPEDTDEQTKAKSRCKKDTWQFVTGVYNDKNSKAYLDGIYTPNFYSGKTEIDVRNVPRYVFGLGGFTAADSSAVSNFSGEIDEVRIRECVSSDEWVAAEYDNALKAEFLTFKSQSSGLVIYVH